MYSGQEVDAWRKSHLVTLKMVTLNPCHLTRWSTRVNQLRCRLAGSCLHKPSYPHHPGGVSQKGEKSHVVPWACSLVQQLTTYPQNRVWGQKWEVLQGAAACINSSDFTLKGQLADQKLTHQVCCVELVSWLQSFRLAAVSDAWNKLSILSLFQRGSSSTARGNFGRNQPTLPHTLHNAPRWRNALTPLQLVSRWRPTFLKEQPWRVGVAVVTEHPFLTGENGLNGRRCFPRLQ
jgi:hypothetical protein